jgi:hypothetical protein
VKKVIAVAAVLLLAACGGASHESQASNQVQHATGPEWVTRGSGAFKSEKGRVFSGVGIASGIRNAAMRRATADARARLEVGTQLDSFISRLSASGNVAGAARSSPERDDQLKTFMLGKTTIVDHWVDNDGSEWALAQLELDKLKGDIDHAQDVDAPAKQAVKTNGDKAFDELNADAGRRQQ